MKAEIITIGDEILIGQIVDTNSAWMAEQFNIHGIEIYQITSVHDSREHILEALKNAAELMKNDPSIQFMQYLETIREIAAKGKHTFLIGDIQGLKPNI